MYRKIRDVYFIFIHRIYEKFMKLEEDKKN